MSFPTANVQMRETVYVFKLFNKNRNNPVYFSSKCFLARRSLKLNTWPLSSEPPNSRAAPVSTVSWLHSFCFTIHSFVPIKEFIESAQLNFWETKFTNFQLSWTTTRFAWARCSTTLRERSDSAERSSPQRSSPIRWTSACECLVIICWRLVIRILQLSTRLRRESFFAGFVLIFSQQYEINNIQLQFGRFRYWLIPVTSANCWVVCSCRSRSSAVWSLDGGDASIRGVESHHGCPSATNSAQVSTDWLIID